MSVGMRRLRRKLGGIFVAALGTGSLVACGAFGTAKSGPVSDAGSEEPDVTTQADVVEAEAPVGCCTGCTTIVAGQPNPTALVAATGENLLWANGAQNGDI